jgi:hypothetical protein
MAGEAQLLQRIVGILNSDPVQKINFSFRKVRVSGSDYGFVALAMVGKASKVKYNFSVIAGAAATYQPANNTFSFPSAGYGASSAFERMTIVHECTHAVIDAKRSSLGSIPQLDNEISAFIGGGLFNVFDGSNYAPSGAGVYPEAHKLTTKIAATINRYHFTNTYSVDDSSAQPLSAAIVNNPAYSGKISPTSPYGDNGLGL